LAAVAGWIDSCFAANRLGLVPEEQHRKWSVSRYETVIATLVGFLALSISSYTAYMQRQQVRASVWPILEYNTSNEPDIHLTLANKGVGPAIVRHVIVRVDGQPVRQWDEALHKLLGPGVHHFSESNISGHVLSAGESMTILTPDDENGKPLSSDKKDGLWVRLDKERARVSVEICYCSTLGECWTLRADNSGGAITETAHCPKPSAISFQQ